MAMRRWVLPCCLCLATARWLDYEESGATPGSSSAAAQNTELLNAMLASLHAGDTLFVPNKTFWLAGGVLLQNARNVTLHLDGTLEFLPGRAGWPEQEGDICNLNPLQPARAKRCIKEAIFIANVSKLTLTSTSGGTLNGHGKSWWGYLQYFFHGENRPRLLSIYNGTDILVEKWNFVDSAYWTFTALDVARMEIRHCTVSARVDKSDDHDLGNMDALNTDGFDVAGRDIHIHHCSVWNQDDCFTVQPRDRTGINADCTENVLVEHVNASGLGLTIGAVRPTPGHNCVRNVTFRDAYMLHTFKGIYLKSQNSPIDGVSGEISNVLYEDIVMDRPSQVPIWIGPAQEADSYKACSLLWPEVPFAGCSPPGASMLWANITLRNVRVLNPKQSPGLVYGNPDRPMQNIHFENVVTVNPGLRPWGRSYYKCEGVAGLATAGTQPAPPCFRQPEPVEEVGLLDYLFA